MTAPSHPGGRRYCFSRLPGPLRCVQQFGRIGELRHSGFLPLFGEQFVRYLLQKLRCGPLLHIEVVLDVAVAQLAIMLLNLVVMLVTRYILPVLGVALPILGAVFGIVQVALGLQIMNNSLRALGII